MKRISEVKLKIICDNMVRVGSRGILGEHGFSAMIEHGGEAVLLDAGQSATAMLNNIATIKEGMTHKGGDAAGAPEVQTDLTVALSHGHFDHSGGLLGLASCGRYKCKVHAHPDAFFKRYKKPEGKMVDISMPFPKSRLLEVRRLSS